ncbi:MAG: type II toxin-antitoxin system PemK/MazF family toxin [Pseudomonadota bacterium]|nr:type II toxin-antitoxin system PemK/MazF family toxin [Pseudomonadota bacterium]
MRRGDIVTVAAPGDYGKPRPAVVIQSDWLANTDSVLVALMTSSLFDAPIYRLTVKATPETGLRTRSQVMVEKILAVPRDKCGERIGRLDETALIALNHMISVMIGIAD